MIMLVQVTNRHIAVYLKLENMAINMQQCCFFKSICTEQIHRTAPECELYLRTNAYLCLLLIPTIVCS